MNLKKNAAEQQKVDEQKKKRHGRLNYNWVGKILFQKINELERELMRAENFSLKNTLNDFVKTTRHLGHDSSQYEPTIVKLNLAKRKLKRDFAQLNKEVR